MTLPKQTNLISRNGTYYYRRRVPSDLLQHYSPKLEIIFSLKTKDLKLAERLSRSEGVRLHEHFERLRANLNVQPQESLSDEDITNLTEAWKAHLLEEDEEVRMMGLADRDYRKLSESIDVVEGGGKKALAMGDISLIEFEMHDFCEGHDFKLSIGSQAYQRLAYAFLKASVEINHKLSLRHQGEVINTPEAPLLRLIQ